MMEVAYVPHYLIKSIPNYITKWIFDLDSINSPREELQAIYGDLDSHDNNEIFDCNFIPFIKRALKFDTARTYLNNNLPFAPVYIDNIEKKTGCIRMLHAYRYYDVHNNIDRISYKKRKSLVVNVDQGNKIKNDLNGVLDGRFNFIIDSNENNDLLIDVCSTFSRHSSLSNGGDIIFAGEIDISDGVVVSFNNKSAHYLPGYDDGKKLTNKLIDLGVDKNEVEKILYDGISKNKKDIVNVKDLNWIKK